MTISRNPNSLRTVLVDGDAYSRRLLRLVLSSCPEVEIVGEARSASAAAVMLETQRPDLVFFDVALPDGDGLEVLRNASERPCIVFVVSDAGYALSAIELEAVDYLVKPLQRKRIGESLVRARQRIMLRNVAGLAARIADEASSFARLGLIVHMTAPLVQPGVNNHQALEMNNAGPMPLALRPGTAVCQIVFETCIGTAHYAGRYRDQESP